MPFNLTKPKPKMIPPPEQIKREVIAKPVPKGMFKKTLADIEAEKAERLAEKAEQAEISIEPELSTSNKLKTSGVALSFL